MNVWHCLVDRTCDEYQYTHNDHCYECGVKHGEAEAYKRIGELLDKINFDDYDIEGVKFSFQHFWVEDLRDGKLPE